MTGWYCNSIKAENKNSLEINEYVDLAKDMKEIWKLEEVIINSAVITATGIVPNPLMEPLQLGLTFLL